jgi:hypothetical protein
MRSFSGELAYSTGRYRAATNAESGTRIVEPTEAATVLRIFRDYGRGRVAQTIAEQLNVEGILEPARTRLPSTAALD